MDILVFGGTTEGRQLVEWLDARGSCHVMACTATAYGASLLPQGEHVTVLQGPLSDDQKQQLMSTHDFCCIVDATHPYALHISDSLAQLGKSYGTDVVRIVRAHTDEDAGLWTSVNSVQEAAGHLAQTTGPILLTTGTKDLACFMEALPDAAQRLYVRILPVADSLARVYELGIPTSHIIAMQGPASTELNCALIREYGIEHLVSKQSGTAGGFEQKVHAAQMCGIELVVIERPRNEQGLSLEEAQTLLEVRYGV